MSSPVTVSAPTFEHHTEAFGVYDTNPRLSWTLNAPPAWQQNAYEIEIQRDGATWSTSRVNSSAQVLVDWPTAALTSRAVATVRVRVWGSDDEPSDWSAPSTVEAGLLDPTDWSAVGIAAPWDEDTSIDNPPPLLRAAFYVGGDVRSARLYVTAHGLAEVEINGSRAGDMALLPGWTVYPHRLRVATIDVTDLVRSGPNAWGAWMGDGWYRGRLGFDGGTRNIYGDRLGLLAQLEVTLTDGRTETFGTGDDWLASPGPITFSSLYDGERYDSTRSRPGWSGGSELFIADGWEPVRVVEFDLTTFTGFDGPPVRRTETIHAVSVNELDNGRYLLDFGQNLVGRLQLTVDAAPGTRIRMMHAEVLEDGQLYRRPLREAASIDEYTTAGTGVETWEPRFTMHGFRYAEVQGWIGDNIADHVVAHVYHNDMRRTGWFGSSNPLLNRLHENVVWSMRGNFVDLPTDCPQRDERLGWTGDIQVFAPTASFLYDCSGFLSSWLKDLTVEQLADGTVPWYVPVIPGGDYWTPIQPGAVWGDAAVLTPWTIWERFGDKGVLARQYDSARRWVDLVAQLSGDDHLWNTGMQLGDWLDPAAPPDDPADARTDRYLVATAYAAWSTRHLSRMAELLNNPHDADRYSTLAKTINAAFIDEYVNEDGTLTSDAPTAYALAITFNLLPAELRARAGDRLAALVAEAGYTIPTGFAGTNVILDALSGTGHRDAAFKLLLQENCPSWLYAVVMGGTTIWERWDSMLPDGSINPGGMTSFNHYALGAVADWMHRRVAGLEALEPGYRTVGFRPEPGGQLTFAYARHLSPYGEVGIGWEIIDGTLHVHLTVPTGATGIAELPGQEPVVVDSGTHHLTAPIGNTTPHVQPRTA
ncbi:alpha-L-rhamnosidase [Leifsonia sp. Leaf264]|uniref:alpha-L-rhamnosidase n=1 Tax=Leifsonia sp. Leaf264 TaxID=1736314 RepID=UPI0006FD60E8|nr:alpha-L-rhamnosidase [Leifsonia sp. Leaf264]KQO97483.1 alpha-L-rhamnosidase [Leifsonia sp. Leaf264]